MAIEFSLEERAIALSREIPGSANDRMLFDWILESCQGLIDRYSRKGISEKDLKQLLRDSCHLYASGNRKIGLVDTFILEVRHRFSDLEVGRISRTEAIEADAYDGTGYTSFERTWTSVQERINISVKPAIREGVLSNAETE